MDDDKAIRSAKLTLGGMLEKKRAKSAVERAQGQIAPSKYLPGVPRQVHADGGKVAYHATHEPFEDYDWSRLGQSTKENTSGTSVDDWAISLAGLGPWSHEKPISKRLGMKTDLPVVLTGKEKKFKSLDHLAQEISRHGGPAALREKLVSQGYGHASVDDEEFGGKSYVGLSPDHFKITKAMGGAHADGGSAGMGDNGGPPLSEPPVDLGAAREQKQLQTFHKSVMGDIGTRMTQAMEAHQKAVDAGHFDGYEVGDVLQGRGSPLKITGRYVQQWKPNRMTLEHFDRLGAKPSIIEHEGKQYVPMLRYTSGSEEGGDNQEGSLYLDAVKATGMRKMGGLRAVKANGGAIHLIHGGADFDEIDPRFSGTGEPGNIRPLGKGLYTFVLDPNDPDSAKEAIGWAKRYATKYGRGKKTLHVFQVPASASTVFNGPRSIEGMGAEPQDKLAAYRAHRDAEPAKDDPAWWDWSRKSNALYEDVKNAADLRMERLPIGLTEAAINNPKVAQRVGKFDPEADPDEIIKAIRGYASGGYVPAAVLPVPKLAVAKPLLYDIARPTALEALAGIAGSASKIGETAGGFFGKEAPPEQPPAQDSHAGRAEAGGGMSPQAVAAYNALLEAYGRPLTVTSTYRDPAENQRVKGAKNSQHMHGNAYDIDTSGMSYEDRLALADMAWNAGFRGVGFYDNSMHFDVGDPRSWGPTYSRDSIPDWAQDWTQQRYGYANGGAAPTMSPLSIEEQMKLDAMRKPDAAAQMDQTLEAISNAGKVGSIAGKLTGIPFGGVMGRKLAESIAMSEYGYADGGAAGGYVPQRTQKAYKLFRTKGDGKLYPLFVHADKPVEMGKWLEAEEGPQGKAQGKVKSKLGDLAYRPGWHAGDLPIATHIGGKSSPDLKKPDYRPDSHVWAEVEMAADKDWQAEADSRGKGVKAHITDQVPLKGFYRYKTNPNMTGNWLIGGHMKVNRVLSDDEVADINRQAGTADLPRLQRADGGPAMFEGMHEDLQNEDGTPMDLWHGTPADKEFEAFDDSKLGSRDAGFFGRGHYMTPERGNAEGYADPDEMGRGTVMGPLHAALKNPYIWDTSSDNAAHRTLRDLQSMGIMRGQGKLEPWDIIQRHDMDTFMQHMQDRGHDGVIVRTHDHTGERPHRVSEVVVFKPNMIKHKDAEVFDPNDARIRRADGGRLSLYSKAAKIVRGMKDQNMDVKDILKYAEGKGAKRAELDHVDVPPGKATPKQVADHIEFMQPQIGVKRLGSQDFRFGDSQAYLDELDRLNNRGRHDEAERLYDEFERFEGYGGDQEPKYARYQLPGGDNYREHILTLDSHSHNDPYYAKAHWGNTPNPLAHVRMSDRYDMYPSQPLVDLLNKAQASSQARDVPTQLEHGVAEGIMSAEEAATIAKRLDLKSSGFYGKPDLDKKILHIEEMQSDWNNDARRKGFRTGTEQEDYQKYVDKMRDEAVSGIDPTASPSIRDALRAKYNTMDPYMLALKMGRQSEHNELARRASGDLGVPQAPYVNPKRDDAMELAMKHVLTEAAKGGYTGIAFTPDEAQKERWGGTEFNGIYNKKLPGMAQKLIRQHDPEGGSDDDPQTIAGWGAPHVELTDKARQSILQNGFSSFRRGGYVTHVRRAR